MTSRILGESRDIVFYLPPGYQEEPERRYPALYLHDGQNLFDPATAFCNQDWRLGSTLDELILARRLEPLIIIGIYNAGEKRIVEYTHVRNRRGVGGGARLYARFLLEELKPFVDGEFRTLSGAVHTGLGGSSLGGLVTLYLGLRFPKVFGKLIVMSPSVWWSSKAILRYVRKAGSASAQEIWLDTGTAEGGNPEMHVAQVREVRDLLLTRGWTSGQNLHYLEDEGGGHNELAWGARMRLALPALFPARED